MKRAIFSLLAGAISSAAAENNVLFYPPQAGPRSRTSDLSVKAGDTLNITWSTGYPSIDLRIVASAPGSNFTATPFFNPGLDPVSFFEYTLQPHDYYTNDSSIPIIAFFRISDNKDSTQLIRSKNFTIEQPGKGVKLDASGIPSNAVTHTGSITLFSSLGTVAASGASSSAAATGTDGSKITSGPNGLAASSGGSTAAPTNKNKSDGGMSTAAKAGLGVGITVAILLLLGLIGAGVFLCRRKRRRQNQPMNQNFGPNGGAYTQTTVVGGQDVKIPEMAHEGNNHHREYYGGKADQVLGVGGAHHGGRVYGEADGSPLNEMEARQVMQFAPSELPASNPR